MFDLKRTVNNKARVEGSIAAKFRIFEITHFISHYSRSDIKTRLNQLFRNEVTQEVEMEDELPIFTLNGRPIGKVENTCPLSTQEYYAAYLYILMNCEEVDGWIE